MIRTIMGAAMLMGGLATPALAAGFAVATSDVNLRAGPSTAYPAVDVVPYGEDVRVHGCLRGRAWCDVSFAGQRGWMSSNYIAFVDGGRRYVGLPAVEAIEPPVISFSFGSYWDNYYRDRPFYRSYRHRDGGWDGPRYGGDEGRRTVREGWRRDDGWRGERPGRDREYRREGEEFVGTDGGVETEYRRPRGWSRGRDH